MSIFQLSADNASSRDERSKSSTTAPANSANEPSGDDRFPKVDDLVDRLTHHTKVSDQKSN